MEVSRATISAYTANSLIVLVSQAVTLLGMMNWLQWRIPLMWAMPYALYIQYDLLSEMMEQFHKKIKKYRPQKKKLSTLKS